MGTAIALPLALVLANPVAGPAALTLVPARRGRDVRRRPRPHRGGRPRLDRAQGRAGGRRPRGAEGAGRVPEGLRAKGPGAGPGADDRGHGLRPRLAHEGGGHGDVGDDPRRGGKGAARRPGGPASPRLRRRRRGTRGGDGRGAPHAPGRPRPRRPDGALRRDPRRDLARKHRQPLAYESGSRFVYSDAGFEALGELVRVVSGDTLDSYVARAVLGPLGMADRVPAAGGRGRERTVPPRSIAPTEARDGAITRGTVHDPRAFALGGVAGHAGLFGTADDLARYAAAILSGGGAVLSRPASPP